MGIKTSILKYDIMKSFVNDLNTSSYYTFASSLENTPTSINSDFSKRTFLEKTIFGKKVDPTTDVKYMIRRITWKYGEVYDQYDDTIDLSTKNYFVISEPEDESGDYYVFKCIFNNYGAPSLDKPTFTSDIALENYTLITGDGYVWKYMYKTTSVQASTYGTKTLFPVFEDQAVINAAKSSIDNILVENPTTNIGYPRQNGTIKEIASNSRIILNADVTFPFNSIRGYYAGYTFYATSTSVGTISKMYIVSDSGVRSSDNSPFVVLIGYNTGDILPGNTVVPSTTTWEYQLLPTVEIVGNGTGASAIPIFNSNSPSTIERIQILNGGQGYTRAVARITKPVLEFNPDDPSSGDRTCFLRAIISPLGYYSGEGGHGKDPVLELGAERVLISSRFDREDNLTIPFTNKYSKIGIVKNPAFTAAAPPVFDNRIKISLLNTTQLSVGQIIRQTSTNFRGVIHEIDGINNLIYITEFFGPYENQNESTSLYLSYLADPPINPSLPIEIDTYRVEPITITYPSYEQLSGEVLYIIDFSPVERSETLTEQFKFIIAF